MTIAEKYDEFLLLEVQTPKYRKVISDWNNLCDKHHKIHKKIGDIYKNRLKIDPQELEKKQKETQNLAKMKYNELQNLFANSEKQFKQNNISK